MDSRALIKIQSTALIAVIVVAIVGGTVAYVLWGGSAQPTQDIIIGVCSDSDTPAGRDIFQGALLAAEQTNAEGGILGRNVTIVSEDDDSLSGGDTFVATNALTRLLTVDKADYVIVGPGSTMVQQDVCSEHKTIHFSVWTPSVEHTQRVLDNYDK